MNSIAETSSIAKVDLPNRSSWLDIARAWYLFHRKELWIFVGLELAVLALVRTWSAWWGIVTVTLHPPGAELIVGTYILLSFTLPVYLGWLFQPKRATSWTRTLPQSDWTSVALPLCLIGLQSAWHLITLFPIFERSPSHRSVAAVTVVAGFQIIAFLAAQRGSGVVGALIRAALGWTGLYLIGFSLGRYISAQSGFMAELISALMVLLIATSVARQRFSAFVATGLILASLIAIRSVPLMLPSDRIANLALQAYYWPSETRIKRYKTAILDAKYWTADQFWERGGHSSVWIMADHLAARSTSNEKLALVKLIMSHPDLFRRKQGDDYIEQGFPIRGRHLDEESQSFVLQNWKDQPLDCSLLPKTPKPIQWKILLQTQHCPVTRDLFSKYHPFERREYDRQFEQFLIDLQRSRNFFQVRIASEKILRYNDWDDDGLTWSQKEDWLQKNPLTPESFARMKSTYYVKERKQIGQWASLSRPEFEKAIKAFPDADTRHTRWHVETTLDYLCHAIREDCFYELVPHDMKDISFYARWVLGGGLLGLNTQRVMQLKKQVLAPEYWERIRALNGVIAKDLKNK